MGVNYFTDEQVENLKRNPHVDKVSNKAINYTENFREHFYNELNKGKIPTQIFREAGFEVNVIGQSRITNFAKRVRKFAEREEGFADTRTSNSGRPATKELTDEEKIKRLEYKNKILQQENDFLKRVRYINKMQIWKVSKIKQQETNTN